MISSVGILIWQNGDRRVAVCKYARSQPVVSTIAKRLQGVSVKFVLIHLVKGEPTVMLKCKVTSLSFAAEMQRTTFNGFMGEPSKI
jgi:hypothetical protein